MKFERREENGAVIYHVSGRVDTATAPELDKELEHGLDGVEDLVFDFDGLKYISSAGLRVLLVAHKRMLTQGKMRFINVSDVVMDIFSITGMKNFLNIER